MKFKKSDLGLYFASSLVGAGAGLLVGAFVASRLTGPEPIYLPDEEKYTRSSAEISFRRVRPRKNDKFEQQVVNAAEKFPTGKKTRKKTIKIKAQDDPELAEFIAEWEPSTIQIEMVKTGLITQEDLQELLIKEELAKETEPYNYSAPYVDKPELADLTKLPEEEEIVDDRYQILRDPPADKDVKTVREVYWDPEDDTFYTLSRNKTPVPADLRGMISEETWDVLVPYFDKGYEALYVDDLKSARFYRFIAVDWESEESQTNDNESDE